MISWKNSFRRLREENEMAKKKRQALDSLLSSGRISQATYDSFNIEIDEAVAEVERQQKALLDKMSCKAEELGTQIRTLEILLANFEIQHVTGEVDEEVYQHEINVLSVGIESAKHELEEVNESVNQLANFNVDSTVDVVVPEKIELQPIETGAAQLQESLEQSLPEPPVQSIETDNKTESFQNQQSTEEQNSTATEAQTEEKQEA